MCDGDHIEKLLSQFLITSDFRLVVNDVDATPVVDYVTGHKEKCGHRQFSDGNTFIAPEMKWPWPGQPFECVHVSMSSCKDHDVTYQRRADAGL